MLFHGCVLEECVTSPQVWTRNIWVSQVWIRIYLLLRICQILSVWVSRKQTPASGLLKYLGLLQQCCFEAEKLQELQEWVWWGWRFGSTWNSKEPVFNGCLVEQPFSI